MIAEGGAKCEEALKKIRATLVSQKGRVDKAANKLKVSPRTLSRWLHDHNIQKFASKLREKNNIPGPRPA